MKTAIELAKETLEYRVDAHTDCRYGSSFAHERRTVIDAVGAMGCVYALVQKTKRYQGNTAGGIAHTLELYQIGGTGLLRSKCITDQYDRSKDNTELFAMKEVQVHASWHVRDSFREDTHRRLTRKEGELRIYPHWVKKGEGGCFLEITYDDVSLQAYFSPSGGGYSITNRYSVYSKKLRLTGDEFTEENLMRIIDESGMRNPPTPSCIPNLDAQTLV